MNCVSGNCPLKNMKKLPLCSVGLFFIIVGIISLAAALIAEYGFGMVPCKLCIYQRVPYVLIIIMGAAIGFSLRHGRKDVAVWILRAIFLILVTGAGIGIYQTGGERDWWELSQGCSADALAEALKNGGDITAALKAQQAVPCDQVSFSVMGLSFASLNAIFSLVLAAVTMFLCRIVRKSDGNK